MKKLIECKKDDKIVKVDPYGSICEFSILHIIDRKIVIDFKTDEPDIEKTNDYYYIFNDSFYCPSENLSKLMDIYRLGMRHGQEKIGKQLRELIGCKN